MSRADGGFWTGVLETVERRGRHLAKDKEVREHYANVHAALAELDRAIGAVQKALTTLAATPPWTLTPACGTAIAVLQNARTRHGDLIQKIEGYFEKSGRPGYLRATASDWTALVMGPISEREAYFNVNKMNIASWWRDKAATAYETHLPLQSQALIAAKDKAKSVAGVLDQLALAISAFWADVDTAVTTFVTDTIKSISGGLGDPLGQVNALINVILGIETSVTGMWKTVETAYGTFAVNAGALEREVNDLKGFPGGKWPRLTYDFDTQRWRPEP